ncbi:diguanylate cyclase domain-containing protein [Thalassotalea euphylliae]|nr:transporter substrate-binding domain-containing protein [Thalassotalea euphylliae]
MDCKKVITFASEVLWFIALLIAFLSTPTLASQVSKPSLKEQYTIAFHQHSYPYQFVNDDGEAEGVFADFWRLWAKRQGVKVTFKLSPWDQSIANVTKHHADFHAGLVAFEGAENLLFSHSIYPHDSFIYVDVNAQDILSLEQLAPYKVGVVKGLANVDAITAANNISIRYFPTRAAMYDALLNGELLAFVEQDEFDQRYARIAELQAIFPKYKRLNYFTGDLQAAVARTNEPLLAFINQGLAKINLSERVGIEKKWLNIAPHIAPQTSVLNLGFASNLAPFMGYSASGKPQGLFIDMWRLWAKQTGTNVNFVGDSLNRSFAQLQRGAIDAHIAFTGTFDETSGLKKATKVYELNSQVFVSNRLPNITSLEQLAGKRVGVFKAAFYVQPLLEQYPDIEFHVFAELANMITAAERGEIDAAISEVETMQVKLVTANLQSLFYVLETPVFPIELFAVVGEGNNQLAEQIKKGFAAIPREDLHTLESIWLTSHENSHYAVAEKGIPLTDEQRHWIAANPVLKVGIVKDWEPLEFLDEEGQPTGINRDVVEAITQGAGFELQYFAYENWSALIDAFRQQELDIVLSVSRSIKQNIDFDFSDSYWQMPWSITYRRILGRIDSLADMNGKTLAVVKGYQLVNWIKTNYPAITVNLVNTTSEGLIAVQQGFVDGFLEGLPVASTFAKQESIVPLEVAVVPEIPPQDSRIGIRKGNLMLQSILNQGLSVIDETMRQEIFNRWFDVNIHTGWDKRLVTRIAAQIGFLIIVIILFVLLWNRRLHKEVDRRKALELQMKHMATHDELTGLANRTLIKTQMESAIALHQRQGLKLAVLFVDLDGFKGVNDKYGHDFGDIVLQQVAERLRGCVRKSDTICRFGGDEFVILLTSLNNKEEAAFIAEKIIDVVSKPFLGDQYQATLGSSIGISVFPEDADNGADLLKTADNLMYRVKSSGKNNFSYR